jgi:hypothetical protein
MCRVKAIVETFNSVTERKNSSLCAEHAAACQRERERGYQVEGFGIFTGTRLVSAQQV